VEVFGEFFPVNHFLCRVRVGFQEALFVVQGREFDVRFDEALRFRPQSTSLEISLHHGWHLHFEFPPYPMTQEPERFIFKLRIMRQNPSGAG
jgi:hypothetical protein